MVSDEAKSSTVSRRLVPGTANSLQDDSAKVVDQTKILSDTSVQIQERLKLFQELYSKQQKDNEEKPDHEIKIIYNGETYQGVSHKTSPLTIMKNLKGLDDVVLAKVNPLFSEDMHHMTCVDLEESEIVECCESSLLWDLSRPLEFSCYLEFLSFETDEGKNVFWHSSCHILGAALEELYGAKLTIGPPLERGFYYDSYMGDLKISQEMYKEIQETANRLIQAKEPFQRLVIDKATALKLFQDNPFKIKLIEGKVPDDGFTSAYRCGNLVDLCRGPHIISTGNVRAFSVEKHSSAYWLGNAENESLQRVYGISFPTVKQMKEYKAIMEKAKLCDHRYLGNKLQLFFFDTKLSPGSCFWLPDGAKLYNKLTNFIRAEYALRGFSEVISPNIFSSDLFSVSGHWQNYKENMYCFDVEGKDWALKPMNCPGHCLMFRHINPSYKQLPLRLADFGVLHRNEASGSLGGLIRVRRFQQDDAHIFCRLDQIQQEVKSALEFLFYVYGVFGFHFEMKLSTRPKKALGNEELWKQAETSLAEAMNSTGKPWKLNPGDGAFYGPKIDVRLQDALQRWHQCGTIQLDFQLPLRFNLTYRTSDMPCQSTTSNESGEISNETCSPVQVASPQKDGSLEEPLKSGFQRPVMIHRAIFGSIERMLGVLLEHTAGRFPFWLSPRQAIVCPVSENFSHYAHKIYNVLLHKGYDVSIDTSNATISKKIREAQINQWNYVLVVGAQEEETGTVMVRDCNNPLHQKKLTLTELENLFSTFKMPSSV